MKGVYGVKGGRRLASGCCADRDERVGDFFD